MAYAMHDNYLTLKHFVIQNMTLRIVLKYHNVIETGDRSKVILVMFIQIFHAYEIF